MDLLPHQAMHLLALGEDERVLRSSTIWLCAGCYACAVRCPNDINITELMDQLRARAVAQGIACPRPEILKFHQTFLKDLARRGRIHELRMMGEYNLKIGKPFNNIHLAPQMFKKGRLRLLPPKTLRGFRRWMEKLCKD